MPSMIPHTIESPAHLLLHHVVTPSAIHPRRDGGLGGPPPTLLTLTAWEDPVLVHSGTDPRGTYAELFWLPMMGPSATPFSQ